MKTSQSLAILAVRAKLIHFLANEHAQGVDMLDECLALLASMNVMGPAYTILETFASSDRKEPWALRVAARAALSFLLAPTTFLVVGRVEAAKLGPMFEALSADIEGQHATTIRLLAEPASGASVALLQDAADRLQAELVNVALAGRYLRHGHPLGSPELKAEAEAVTDIRDAAEHLRQAERLLRSAATTIAAPMHPVVEALATVELDRIKARPSPDAQLVDEAADTVPPRREGSS